MLKIGIILSINTLFSYSSYAHQHPAYSHERTMQLSQADWMGQLREDIRLSELSIPGTHNSLSFYGGPITQTQSMSLKNQLESGIRVLDVRCGHVNNSCAIYHGSTSQNQMFDAVLTTVIHFLNEHPRETIIMRIKKDYSSNNNTESFEKTFRNKYWLNEVYANYFWHLSEKNPQLGQVRGKIVILQNFQGIERYGLTYRKDLNIQDDYLLNTNWDLYKKWNKIKHHLNAANKDNDRIYVNFLSGSKGSFPYFVASGHMNAGTSAPRLSTGLTTLIVNDLWPDFPRIACFIGICTIAFEGCNTLVFEHIDSTYKNHIGIIMADFPGYGLINKIIKLNDTYQINILKKKRS